MQKKLSLNKKAVAKLSNDQMKMVAGGRQEQFLSIFQCITNANTCQCTAAGCPPPEQL